MSEEVIGTLSTVAVITSLLGPPILGFWLFRRGGHGYLGALGRAGWMMLLGVIPIVTVIFGASLAGMRYPSLIMLLMPLASFGFFWRLSRVQSEQESTAVASLREATDSDVIDAYAAALERGGVTPGCIADESKLPYSKQRIARALLSAIRNNTDAPYRDVLATAYLCLPDWQPGVGDEDVGIDLIGGGYSADLRERAGQIVADGERAEPFELLRERESEQVRQKLAKLGVRLTS